MLNVNKLAKQVIDGFPATILNGLSEHQLDLVTEAVEALAAPIQHVDYDERQSILDEAMVREQMMSH